MVSVRWFSVHSCGRLPGLLESPFKWRMADQIRTALREFIGNEKLRVLAITSPWGKGKTYRWREWRQSFQEEGNIGKCVPVHVTYASLFGVKDIDEVYLRLTANVELLKGAPPWWQRMWRWTRIPKFYRKWRLDRVHAVFRDLELTAPGFRLKTARIWAEAARTSLKDSLVCLDDLERKQPELPATAILGLIDELVAQRGCRVVLIYNDDKLTEAERSAIASYREKIIDRQIRYTPELAELRKIVWEKDAPSAVREVLDQAGVDNIRVLRLICLMLEYFEPAFRACPTAWPGFQAQATKLAILHYCYPDLVSIEELGVTDLASLYLGEGNSSKPDNATQESAASARLRTAKLDCLKRVGYQFERPSDALVIGFLKEGYVDLESTRSMLEDIEREAIASEHGVVEQNFWAIYRSNFTVDGKRWAADFVQFVEKRWEYLSLRDIDCVAQFLVKEGLSTHDFEPLLERAIKRRAHEIFEEQHLGTHSPRQERLLTQLSASVHTRLNDELERLRSQTPWTPIHALEATSSHGKGWNSHDLEPLRKLTQADWAKFLENETHPELIGLLGEFIERHGREHGDIADRLMAALDSQIAPRSGFDEIRVRHLKERYLGVGGEGSASG